jgi:hypothetical protein
MLRKLIGIILIGCLVCFGCRIAFGADDAQSAAPPAQGEVQRADLPAETADDARLLGGIGKPGGKGLKKIDPEKFAMPALGAFAIGSALIGLAIFAIKLALFIAIVLAIIYLLRRRKKTGSILPTPEDSFLVAALDAIYGRVEARRTELIKELGQIEKRRAKMAPRPAAPKRKARNAK